MYSGVTGLTFRPEIDCLEVLETDAGVESKSFARLLSCTVSPTHFS